MVTSQLASGPPAGSKLARAPGPDERLLHRLLGQVPIDDDAAGSGQHPAMVGPEGGLELFRGAQPGAADATAGRGVDDGASMPV